MWSQVQCGISRWFQFPWIVVPVCRYIICRKSSEIKHSSSRKTKLLTNQWYALRSVSHWFTWVGDTQVHRTLDNSSLCTADRTPEYLWINERILRSDRPKKLTLSNFPVIPGSMWHFPMIPLSMTYGSSMSVHYLLQEFWNRTLKFMTNQWYAPLWSASHWFTWVGDTQVHRALDNSSLCADRTPECLWINERILRSDRRIVVEILAHDF